MDLVDPTLQTPSEEGVGGHTAAAVAAVRFAGVKTMHIVHTVGVSVTVRMGGY